MPHQFVIPTPVASGPGPSLSSLSLTGLTVDLLAEAQVRNDLLHRLSAISDGRGDQGRSHPVAVVLTLAACAVVAGMRSFTAIAGWTADVEQRVLDLLYAPFRHSGTQANAPSKVTMWRVITGVDGDHFDAIVGAWLSEQAGNGATSAAIDVGGRTAVVGLHVDGKAVRGAKDEHGGQVHLLAAMTSDNGLVVAQTEVGVKTNEIPMFRTLLDGLDIARTLITADCLHTQRGHAEYLYRRGADFIFCVKGNQPKLFEALDVLPWRDVPITHRQTDRGHGRITTRTIQVLPCPHDLPFPHVKQVFLIERHVTDLAGNELSHIAVLGITSLDADRGTPETIARSVRHHWGIEVLHWIRDTLYREDHSTARTRSGPRNMATLRNLAIGAIRLAGRTDITETTRWAARRSHRPLDLLGLTM